MAVVMYHFAIAGFDGSFVGVDVFFIISVLMTGIISNGLSVAIFPSGVSTWPVSGGFSRP
ncbi:hypothetical protein [Azotobacter armeniacus]